MERNTMFYEALETAGLKVQYDGHVKKLLSFRQVISQILTRTLTEYEGCTPQEAHIGLNRKQSPGTVQRRTVRSQKRIP